MSASRIAWMALAALLSIASIDATASAQTAAEEEALEEERAGRARGGSYAWGDSSTDVPALAGPAERRYGRIFGTVGVGFSIRILEYQTLNQGRLAPGYLQLRAGYFFEGEGDIQHGAGLGISTNITLDGLAYDPTPDVIAGQNPLTAWTFVANYFLRGWFGDWFQLIGRVGVGVTASSLPNWGFEVGLHPVLKILSGFGFYAEAGFSMYFADDIHPLISLEGGVVFDYELLP